MNPFQRARDEALKIREKLCPNGPNDPISAKDLLSKVEEVLELAIYVVPATYPDLCGSSAVLKRQQQSIYVNDRFVEWGEEFCGLVAHELGHWLLDPEQSETSVSDISTVFGGDGSPAVVKVEAYGARERQELQANVFAKELLLPRHVAKTLAYAGMGPLDASKETGIPLEFVRQQMLDALLLPAPEIDALTLHPASPDQEKAAKAAEQFANVVAGPGTGKTSTLIHRIKYLIEEKGVDPNKLLVLTFTNKAAFELVERLKCMDIERAADIWAGTFHAFGLEFLRKYHQKFSLGADLNVADKMLSVTTLIKALPQLHLQHYHRLQDPYDWVGSIVTGITRLKEELVTPNAYKEFISKNKEEDQELQNRREDVATLYQAHEEALAEMHVVDFVDLITKPSAALASDRESFADILDRFEYILVDEYQDVTQAMVELLRQLALKKSLWVVGDVRQSIHHWRGASLRSLLKFDSVFKTHAGNGKIGKYPLEFNRRSSPEILELIQEVGKKHIIQSELPLDAMTATRKNSGFKPLLVTCAKRSGIALAIEENIASCVNSGTSHGEQAVLCRSSSEVYQIAEYLKERGVPVLHIGDIYERKEIKFLLCLMQLLVEKRPRALIGLGSEPRFSMPMADIHLLINAAKNDIKYQRGKWIKNPPLGLSDKAESARIALEKLIGGYSYNTNPWSFVCDLLLEHRLCLPGEKDLSVSDWAQRIALWQFAYAVRNGDGDMRQARLIRFLLRQRIRQRIGDTYSGRGFPPEASSLDGIRIETIHGSKGLEFNATHIAFITASSYSAVAPTWRPPENILDIVPPEVLGSSPKEYLNEEAVERNNLLYVAVSRARNSLYLYQDNEFGDRTLAPQLFDCEDLAQHLSFTRHLQVKHASSAKSSFATPTSMPFDHFSMYSTCPLQYWYAKVQNLDREQEIDLSLRARWTIMSALELVAKECAQSDEAMQIEWEKSKLPTEEEDPTLWRDSEIAYTRGVKLIESLKSAGGIYTQPTSIVAGLKITLPWGYILSTPHSTTFQLIRFNRSGLENLKTLLKPIVLGLEIPGTKKVDLHCVMSDIVDNAPMARRVEQTKGYKAAVSLSKGDINPTRGHQCARCAYSTICPAAPSI